MASPQVAAEVGRLMGESLARGADREMAARGRLLLLRFELLSLELGLFLVGGPVPA